MQWKNWINQPTKWLTDLYLLPSSYTDDYRDDDDDRNHLCIQP